MKKHSHTKLLDQSQPTMPGVIISGDFKSRNRLFRITHSLRNSPYISAGLLLLLAAGVLYLAFMPRGIESPPKVDTTNVFEYSDMTKEQRNYVLYTKTGLTLEYLENKGINHSTLTNFDNSIEVAKVMASMGDKAAALQAYEIAFDKKADDGTYQFNLDYAHYALSAGNKVIWKKQMLIAREVAAKSQVTYENDPYSISTVQRIDGEIVIVEGASSEE